MKFRVPSWKKPLTRWFPLVIIAGLVCAFSAAGGNHTSCGGACFVPEATAVPASRR